MDEEEMKRQMRALLTSVQTWEGRIRKTTFVSSVGFHPHQNGEFSIRVDWVTKAGTRKAYEKKFSYELVFGPAARRVSPPMVRRTPCSFMREFMQEVLAKRGVA